MGAPLAGGPKPALGGNNALDNVLKQDNTGPPRSTFLDDIKTNDPKPAESSYLNKLETNTPAPTAGRPRMNMGGAKKPEPPKPVATGPKKGIMDDLDDLDF